MVKKRGDSDFWLICPNWVEVLRFSIKNKNSGILYVEQGIVMGNFGEKPPLMKNRKEMKIKDARVYWLKLLNEGWQQTGPKW
tara:strand:+ start:3421 stop:3666 length:246 start_codon:yes stop_codon:yes gene_type:complete